MNVFEEIKTRTDIIRLCDVVGIKLNRNNMCICPFQNHKEKTPSFSVLPSKNIFYCFGCGKKGDVITLVEELFNMQPLQAASYINTHLGLGIDFDSQKNDKKYQSLVNQYVEIRESKKFFEKKKNKIFQNLCDYLHLLEKWKKEEPPFSNLYIKSLHEIDKINYYLDLFIYGNENDIKWFVNNNEKEVKRIDRRIRERIS